MVTAETAARGIASHMAVDFSKNGGMRSTAFGDGAMLTCLGNDLGYENVFAQQVELQGRPGDVLIAISSSGKSPNILSGVEAARARQARIVTFSGFTRKSAAQDRRRQFLCPTPTSTASSRWLIRR